MKFNADLESQEPERTEVCFIKMKLLGESVLKHFHAIQTLVGLKANDGDTINISYQFYISYFGGIVASLKAVNEMCSDPDVVVSVDCDLLKEGECLALEVLTNLNQLAQKIKDRQ